MPAACGTSDSRRGQRPDQRVARVDLQNRLPGAGPPGPAHEPLHLQVGPAAASRENHGRIHEPVGGAHVRDLGAQGRLHGGDEGVDALGRLRLLALERELREVEPPLVIERSGFPSKVPS